MISQRVRFGVMGCADIAWRRMLPTMTAEPSVHLVAVASRTDEKAARFAKRFGCLGITGYQALLDRTDIDAVYIPLPSALHAEWIRRALLADKHVLAEKPLTTSHPATVELVHLAGERGLVLLENYMFLHHSQHAEIRRLLDAGTIGKLRGLSAAFTIPPKPDDDIRYQADVGAGALFDIGGYPIRLAMHFLGSDPRVAGAMLKVSPTKGVVVSGSALLHTGDGVAAQVMFGMEHAYRNRYELFGSTGTIRLDRAFTPPETYQPVLRIERQDHREDITLPADHQFANALGFFVGAVFGRTGTEAMTSATVRQAALVAEVAATADVVERGMYDTHRSAASRA